MSFEIVVKPETIAFPIGVIYFEMNAQAIPHLDHSDDVCDVLLNWTQSIRLLLDGPDKMVQNAFFTIERIDYQFKITSQDQIALIPIQECVTKVLEATRLVIQRAKFCQISNPGITELKNQAEQLYQASMHPEDIKFFKYAITVINRYEELGFPIGHEPVWLLRPSISEINNRVEVEELLSLYIDYEFFESHAEIKQIFISARDVYRQLLVKCSSKVFLPQAISLEGDWVQCPECQNAWQAEADHFIECPKCETLWRSPILQKI